ncbi:hypothetical protein KX729_08725 [Rhizobium sp. XQZ8]|uniref:hypothetical protein n=1 Tax=Rhizobium populisoli TaxID=2859785 RepID=UPI001CA592C0|nr:hypothetical protein [Rhizobium populisoli]MBW6421523.1 hypothetical protein [Rhizobium populisoli]
MSDQYIDHVPPPDVAQAAEKGLELRARFRRGGTTLGIARAKDIRNRKPLSEKTVRKMVSYFHRHKTDKRADNFGDDDNPSTGYIAWLLWGGDPGQQWAEEHKRAIERSKQEGRMQRYQQ